jgi:RES domain
MSSPISTPEELSSSSQQLSGRCWRVVEAQNKISTAKLTDSALEQHALELLIEKTKPVIPPEARGLHYLIATPFRYGAPYPRGSRFRRAGNTLGVFYASEHPHTAIAELCFHRLLFFSESPNTKWPSDAGEYTAFAVDYSAMSIDLTLAPLAHSSALWTHVTNYEACQAIADLARTINVDLIKYASVRDPVHRKNIAILHPRALAMTEPNARQTWRLLLGTNGARALCEMPAEAIDFDQKAFQSDPRIAAMRWAR